MELTNFDDYQGQVVREGAVPPGGHPVKNRPLHLRQSQLRRTEDQVFQTALTEHLESLRARHSKTHPQIGLYRFD